LPTDWVRVHQSQIVDEAVLLFLDFLQFFLGKASSVWLTVRYVQLGEGAVFFSGNLLGELAARNFLILFIEPLLIQWLRNIH